MNMLASFNSDNQIITKLPAGELVDELNDVIVVCIVSDSYGAVSNVSSTVEVKPFVISVPSEEANTNPNNSNTEG